MQKVIDREYNLDPLLKNGWKIKNIIETSSGKNYIIEKDNPVPSLTKRDYTILLELTKGATNVHDYIAEDLLDIIKKLHLILRNGVETDNEQPITKLAELVAPLRHPKFYDDYKEGFSNGVKHTLTYFGENKKKFTNRIPTYLKYDGDYRKFPKWEKIIAFQKVGELYEIAHTAKFGWVCTKECKFK